MPLIIEIGAGIAPDNASESFWTKNSAEYKDWFQITADARYIGVERDAAALSRVAATTAVHERISFEEGDGRVLRFSDASADEVVMCNVLGDPDITEGDKHEILNEAARILRPGGVLRIVEVYTPLLLVEEDMYAYLDAMPAMRAFTAEEYDSLPRHDSSSDTALQRDFAAAFSFFGNQSRVLRYRRL